MSSQPHRNSDLSPAAPHHRLPVTVVMPVKAEADNIGAALESVAWANHVVVVDSGSTDGTVEAAEAAGAEVIQFDYAAAGMKKKRWVLRHLDFDDPWLFFLDADERVTRKLREEIAEAIRDRDVVGWYVDRELIFMGRSLRAFRPNWNLRLLRTGRAELEDFGLDLLSGTGDNEIHEHFHVSGATGRLSSPLLHDDYRGIGAWVRRHETYATWEAALYARLAEEPLGWSLVGSLKRDPVHRNRMLRRAWVRLPGKPVLRFLIWYVIRGGFRDGFPGFIYCALLGWYELVISLKRRELAWAGRAGPT